VNQYCDWNNPTSQCQKALNVAANEVGNVDIYWIYDPECINNQGGSNSIASLMKWNNMTTTEAAARIRAGEVLKEPVQHYNKIPISPARKMLYQALGYTESGPAACINAGGLPTYLNTLAVRQALHVIEDMNYHWTICSGNISYTPT
jgi:Serine carboxypeptidase